MTTIPPVAQALTELGIPHRIFRHSGPVRSFEQAAAERGQTPDQIVRSLLFRVADDDFVMVLVAGPQQIPWRVLRKRLNQNRLTTADRDDVVRVTGYQIGAVSPFGVPQPLRVLVDAGVLRPSEISIGSGERGVTVILDSAELRRALDLSPNAVEYVDLTQ